MQRVNIMANHRIDLRQVTDTMVYITVIKVPRKHYFFSVRFSRKSGGHVFSSSLVGPRGTTSDPYSSHDNRPSLEIIIVY